jgi:hypothetical protein
VLLHVLSVISVVIHILYHMSLQIRHIMKLVKHAVFTFLVENYLRCIFFRLFLVMFVLQLLTVVISNSTYIHLYDVALFVFVCLLPNALVCVFVLKVLIFGSTLAVCIFVVLRVL